MSNTPILSIQTLSLWHFWCRGMCVQRTTPKTHFLAFQTHSKGNCVATSGAQVWAFGALNQEKHVSALRISETPILGTERCSCWHFWCRIMCVQCATPEPYFFGIVHFKHTHTICPNTILVALLMQRYAHFAGHTKNTHFPTLSSALWFEVCFDSLRFCCGVLRTR